MKTASIRQVRHDFNTVLDWIDAGEQVEISKRGKVVALLSPPPPVKVSRSRKGPDFAARLKMRDGGRVISVGVMDEILADSKGSY
jgi:antitoxin (DNA-binding transcriptional repressor) of toxin-antitoxin stability system